MADHVVLVMTDDPGVRDLIRILLEEGLGVRTKVAKCGEAALRQAGEMKPALVVLDLTPPDFEGLGVAALLKADPLTRGIPVIALSAENKSRREAFSAGCDDWLEKPLNLDALVSRVQNHLPADKLYCAKIERH